MEYLNSTTIALALLGMFIHLLMFVAAKIDGNNKFSFRVWWADRMNWIRIMLSLASTAAILLMLDDISALFGVTIEGHGGLLKLVAFGAGYLNHSLIKNILRVFKKATKTSEIVEDGK